jgi:hypothetical protein
MPPYRTIPSNEEPEFQSSPSYTLSSATVWLDLAFHKRQVTHQHFAVDFLN